METSETKFHEVSHEVIERTAFSENIRVSVVIPHFYPSREENLNRIISDLRLQTFRDVELIVVRGVAPQGRAINQGARQARGEILIVMDDDSRIGHSKVVENLVRVIRENPDVAMAGASIITPKDANAFQRRAARQFPRFNMPVVKEVTESDLPCHGLVAFRKDVFVKVGMEREDILRGLDPDLRVRIRKAGYKVVLAPDTWAYHPLPESFFKFLCLFFRNGYGSAYLQCVHPEMNYDTDERLTARDFVPKRSFLYRVLRFPLRLLKSLVMFQWIRLSGYSVYLLGYAAGWFLFGLLGRREL